MPDSGNGVLALHPFTVNRKLPLWYQVAQHLRASILAAPRSGRSRLPVEEDLAAHYAISVMTMRQALRELEDEGLITRRRRTGTVINPRPDGRRLRLLGTVDAVVSQQKSDSVVVLSQEPVAPPEEFAAHFTGEVVRFRRLRKDNGEVTSYAENFVPADIAAKIDVADLATMPMTAVLRDRLGIHIGKIEDTAQACLAAPDIANLLEIALTSPVLYCVGMSRDTHGRVVDIASIHYRGDRFTFAVTFDTQ